MRKLFLILLSFFPSTALSQSSAFVYWAGIQGGGSYESAVPLPTGRALRLNHQQGKDRYDCFVVELKGGQTLVLTITTGTKGIEVRPNNTYIETERPYAGIEVHDARQNPLGAIELVGEGNMQKTLEVDASTPQRLYVLVGSPYEGMHKDDVIFRADIRSNFDGGGDRDAGSSLETALPLGEGKDYLNNYLTRNDDVDYFRIPTSPGEWLDLRIVPENRKTHLQAALYDEVRKELARGRSPEAGAGVSIDGEATGNATYLRVLRDVGDQPTRYTIDIPQKTLPPVVRLPLDYRPYFLRD